MGQFQESLVGFKSPGLFFRLGLGRLLGPSWCKPDGLELLQTGRYMVPCRRDTSVIQEHFSENGNLEQGRVNGDPMMSQGVVEG